MTPPDLNQISRCFRFISRPHLLVSIVCLFALPLLAQVSDSDRPIPVLTGNAGYFTNIEGGHAELNPQISPVLLVPMGDRWLVEARGEFEGDFERPDGGGAYAGKVSKDLDYVQLDYIVNPYITITAGRFLTPFNMYNERLLSHLDTKAAASSANFPDRDRLQRWTHVSRRVSAQLEI